MEIPPPMVGHCEFVVHRSKFDFLLSCNWQMAGDCMVCGVGGGGEREIEEGDGTPRAW